MKIIIISQTLYVFRICPVYFMKIKAILLVIMLLSACQSAQAPSPPKQLVAAVYFKPRSVSFPVIELSENGSGRYSVGDFSLRNFDSSSHRKRLINEDLDISLKRMIVGGPLIETVDKVKTIGKQ